jgi:hypothetical protein
LYTRRILCLANSIKHGGCCVAGRSIDNGVIGEWLRPVSARESHELSPRECRYGFRLGDVSVGDIADVRLCKACALSHQPENHAIDGARAWEKVGRATWTTAFAAQDDIDTEFWRDYGSSGRGCSDSIPKESVTRLVRSLQLIYLSRLELLVQKRYTYNDKVAIRARFRIANREYVLKVTDPVVVAAYQNQPLGTYPIGMALLCVSVSELFKGFAYRLVASIITPRRFETDR